MRIVRYAGKRLLFLLPQLLVVSFIVFFLIRLLPGDPAYLLAGQFATPERMVEVRHDLRLNLPLLEQYGIYLLNILHGDFGNSRRTSQSVMTDVSQRLATCDSPSEAKGPLPARDRTGPRRPM
jgi:peptide/nickel transport system permease protein